MSDSHSRDKRDSRDDDDDDDDDDDVGLHVLGYRVDILGTNCDQCVSMVQCCFTSTETIRLIRTGSPGRPPRLSHRSWLPETVVAGVPPLIFHGDAFCDALRERRAARGIMTNLAQRRRIFHGSNPEGDWTNFYANTFTVINLILLQCWAPWYVRDLLCHITCNS